MTELNLQQPKHNCCHKNFASSVMFTNNDVIKQKPSETKAVAPHLSIRLTINLCGLNLGANKQNCFAIKPYNFAYFKFI